MDKAGVESCQELFKFRQFKLPAVADRQVGGDNRGFVGSDEVFQRLFRLAVQVIRHRIDLFHRDGVVALFGCLPLLRDLFHLLVDRFGSGNIFFVDVLRGRTLYHGFVQTVGINFHLDGGIFHEQGE